MDIRESDRSCNKCGNTEEQCECADNAEASSENKAERYLEAMFSLGANGEAKVNMFLCYVCLEYGGAYMVTDMVWRAAWPTYVQDKSVLKRVYAEKFPGRHEITPTGLKPKPKASLHAEHAVYGMLCLECLEMKLGRRLKISDFTEAKINNDIRFAYAMGLKK
jgi:hypothetical protein